MKLSDKILTLRKRGGMSQEELAEKLNVSRQAVSRWELGSAQPDANNILQISKLFGVTADYLLNDDYDSDNDLPKVKKSERITAGRFLFIWSRWKSWCSSCSSCACLSCKMFSSA